MLNRRRLLKESAAAALAAMLLPSSKFRHDTLIDKVGIQLFSLPKLLEKDFAAALSMLSSMGYKELELYGPYDFSTDAAKKSWDKVTPALGFKGSGYFGLKATDVKRLLKQNGLTAPSMHTDLDTLEHGMNQLAEAANFIGSEYVVLPAIPGDKRKTLDDYRKMADTFNGIGDAAKKQGVKFAYHNHGYGLKEMDGQVPLKLILDNTDPSLVFLEMDLYWTTAGGADPIGYLQNYPDRYRLMHVKDMTKKMQFSGDGGDSNQWIELFPYMTTAGNGVIDLKTILPKAKEMGVKHFIVEQDMVANPESALKKSIDYLQGL
jgi:sugar phosphate isomerase/epimerase